MKIQYASDLHLEFQVNQQFLSKHSLPFIGEVLILAGDIVPLKLLKKYILYFKYLGDNFEQVFWIPGNHEFYNYDIADKGKQFHEKLFGNVHLLHNSTVEYNSVSLIFSTLWSHISKANSIAIENRLNDFRLIKYGKMLLTVAQYNELHKESLSFVESALRENRNKQKVVVTHHVPTRFNYPPQYKESNINEAFAVELYDLIESYGPDYWIYGHSHRNVDDFTIGKTRLITNQLGYVQYAETENFNYGKVIELA